MATTTAIHALAEWLRREVCPNLEFKVPDNESQTDEYRYELRHPSVYEMFAPPSRLAQMQNREMCPGILVHLTDGDDSPRKPQRVYKFRLLLCVWNPGTHPQDGGGAEEFVANANGWNDVWNMNDALLMKLKNAETIGGVLRIKGEDGFHYEPYKEDEAIIDFYPFFFATLEFSCEATMVPSTKYIDEYL